jgi:hypothetical protein
MFIYSFTKLILLETLWIAVQQSPQKAKMVNLVCLVREGPGPPQQTATSAHAPVRMAASLGAENVENTAATQDND